MDTAPNRTEPEPLGTGWLTVVVVTGVMAALIALGGMVLSFRAVSTEMIPAFGVRWAWLVPLVVDLTVFVFSGVDLVLARLDMSHPLARWTVYGATAGTVWLNYNAGGNIAGRTAHVLMPSIWVVFVELMRHVVRRQTNLATGSHREPIPAARWLLSPISTFLLFRRMALWRQHSYPRAVALERTRLGAVAAARQIHGRAWRRRVGPLMRLQIGLAELDAAAVAAALKPTPAEPPANQPQPNPAAPNPNRGPAEPNPEPANPNRNSQPNPNRRTGTPAPRRNPAPNRTGATVTNIGEPRLKAIRKMAADNGGNVTLAAIQAAFGVSKTTASGLRKTALAGPDTDAAADPEAGAA